MSEDLLRQTLQRGGCRLCMSPDTECVSIFSTSAADKEPLSSKILACVSIKVHQADRMSARICHACISYLNSWQSFKNRCYAAQKKQRSQLEGATVQPDRPAAVSILKPQHKVMNQQQILQHAAATQQRQRALQRMQFQQQRILKTALLSGKPPAAPAAVPPVVVPPVFSSGEVDVSFIKDEPIDPDTEAMPEEQEDEEDIVDPMQFLANEGEYNESMENDDSIPAFENNEETGENGGPPILTSLGLTHINHNSEYGDTSANEGDLDESSSMPPPYSLYRPLPPHCTICRMKFSNRANARRHERNIHGKVIDQGAAAAAMLQLSRYQQISITAPVRPVANGGAALPPPPRQRPSAAEPRLVFDYDNPQQYRSQLTDSKLYFIKRNIEFLEQYQTMTCKCCDRTYPTYKLFMAHMRKKYDNLSRNLCFKCLKQFDTKSLFIGHLKKKNCINLYRVYRADPTISKDPLPINHKSGTKEIIGNKVYGCKLCDKTFRLKVDFRTHVNFDHIADQRREHSANGCAYCDIVFEDAGARKRHFNNLECIVFLICGTCDDKFDTLTMYIEHVYAEHLPQAALNTCKPEDVAITSTDELTITKEDPAALDTTNETEPNTALRNPQNCTVCGKLYNNYYNMLRHMESKHPNDLPLTYQCEDCEEGFPRQVDLRDHIATAHGSKAKREQTYSCRQCSDTFEQKDAWLEHQANTHSRYACCMCDLDTENRAEFEDHLNEHTSLRGNQCTICEHSFNSERSLETHLTVVHGIRKTPLTQRLSVRSSTDDAAAKDKPRWSGRHDGEDDIKEEEEDAMRIDNEEDNDGDLDETVAAPVKRVKYDMLSPNGDPSGIRKCKLCQETFLGNIALSNHMRTHGVINSRSNMHKSSMAQRFHNRIMPSSTIKTKVISRMRCRICQKRIHTKTSYKRHMLNIHGVRDCVFIKCTVCPAEFSNDKGLKVHMFRTHHISVQQMQQDVRLRPVAKKESTTVEASKMFECNICHTVYRSKEQMQSHQATVHGIEAGEVVDVKSEPVSNDEQEMEMDESALDETFEPHTIWWQCRYCDETFNASKKLTIHMNSHQEHDTNDNTCVDCGNIYRTRKSLWVHRHKKHPRHPNPTPCELCSKVFFDKTELMHHLRTHSNTDIFPHLSEMQAQLAEELQQQSAGAGSEEMACHICGQTFYDKRVLSKHLRTHEAGGPHENGSVAENTNSSDYSYPSYQGQMVDGEYACDMCPKTFPLITALKVHRGWHFRSPDGRQVTDTGNMWQPDMGRGSAAAAAAAASIPAFKRSRSGGPRIPSCPYCSSTFASGNNLRRHIVEVHKKNEAKTIRENGTFSDSISIEKELECRMCDITFSNHPEWVDHKISHARTMKPSTTFEWGCEICGRIFTRKERLLAHMTTHLSGKRISSGQNSDTGDGGNSNSMSSNPRAPVTYGMSRLRQQLQKPLGHPGTADAEDAYDDNQEEYADDDEQMGEEEDDEEEREGYGEEEEEEEDEEDRDGEVDQDEDEDQVASQNNGVMAEGSDDDADDDNEDDEIDDDDNDAPATKRPAAYSCDLCQVFFKTAKELRRHVTSHIINGPDVPATSSAANTVAATTTTKPPSPVISSGGGSKLDGFKCRLCGSSSESHIDMIACMEGHKVVTSLRCGECKLYFADAEQVLDHENLCHPKSFAS